MNKVSVVAMLLAGIMMAGCDDKPSDKVASEVIRKIADNDAVEGLAVSNFERANGQLDPNSANLYKVTYSYNLKLTKPYGEVVLANAKLYLKDVQDSVGRESGGFWDPTALQNNLSTMQESMTVNQWLGNQGDAFVARRDAFLDACQPCLAYWNSKDAPSEAVQRRKAFLMSWIGLEQYGFKDTAKTGDSVPRQAWAFFSKTEKGWQQAN